MGKIRYLSFCNQFRLSPTLASQETLCKFVSYLTMNNVSWATLKVYLLAVRQLHISQGLTLPSMSEMEKLTQVLRGIRISQASKETAAPRKRLPITPDLLHRIKAQWQAEGISYDKIMLWAAFTTCFFGFLRSGEVCSNNAQAVTPEDLSADCISVDSIQNPQIVKLHLKVSKTDPFREGRDIFLPHTLDGLCPVAALLSWIV